MRIAIVTCTQKKLTRPAPAWLMYMPSPSFRTIAEYALSECDTYLILSAKYGLVSPQYPLDPYDLRAKDVKGPRVAEIAAQVANACQGAEEVRYYGGNDYLKFLSQVEYTRGLEGSLYTRLQGKPKASGPAAGSTLPIVEVFADAFFSRDRQFQEVVDEINRKYDHPVTRRCQQDRLLKCGSFAVENGVIRYLGHPLDR